MIEQKLNIDKIREIAKNARSVVTEPMEDICATCGEESTHGCHGIKNGEVYSVYSCDAHQKIVCNEPTD